VLLRVRNFYAQSEVQARLRELADRRPTLRLPDRGMVQTPLHGVALGGVDTALADVLLNNVIAALATFRQISVTQLASATGKATWSSLEMSAKALGTLGQQSALTLKAAGEYAVSGTSAMVVDSAEYVKRVRRPFSQSFLLRHILTSILVFYFLPISVHGALAGEQEQGDRAELGRDGHRAVAQHLRQRGVPLGRRPVPRAFPQLQHVLRRHRVDPRQVVLRGDGEGNHRQVPVRVGHGALPAPQRSRAAGRASVRPAAVIVARWGEGPAAAAVDVARVVDVAAQLLEQVRVLCLHSFI